MLLKTNLPFSVTYKKLFIHKRVYSIICFFFVCLFNTLAIQAFQHNDNVKENLADIDSKTLGANVFKYQSDTLKSRIYAYEYLRRAKNEKDSLKIFKGYYLLSLVGNTSKGINYCDSIITFSKKNATQSFPMLAYLRKANIHYYNGNYKIAFDFYLKTIEEAEIFKDLYILNLAKMNIGILKSRVGEQQTALGELKASHNFFSKNSNANKYDYLKSLFALSDVYNLNKKLDSASIINNLGYREAPLLGYERFKYHFTLNEGINQYDRKNYAAAKDSLELAARTLEEDDNLANVSMAHFYLGKTLKALGEDEKAIASHILVDSIFQQIKEIMPNNRENYEILIDYYKQQGDIDNQLKYIKRLITVDSVLNTNYRYLIKNVVQNYDTPKLLAAKQEIIDQLEAGSQRSYTYIYILLGISGMLLTLWLVNHQKQKTYKQRFEALYHTNTIKEPTPAPTPTLSPSKPALQIPEAVITEVLQKLERFEKEEGYRERDLSVASLAKEFGTNAKYLSKIINTHLEKPFQQYINELRIDYAVAQLKADSKFRKYTILAIARECGFKKATTFSSAFYKYHGIQPSYFIKELEKELTKPTT